MADIRRTGQQPKRKPEQPPGIAYTAHARVAAAAGLLGLGMHRMINGIKRQLARLAAPTRTRVGGQQAPVDVGSVAQVGVVRLLRQPWEHVWTA